MPKFQVIYTDDKGKERSTTVTADNCDKAAEMVMDEQGCNCIEEVEKIG